MIFGLSWTELAKQKKLVIFVQKLWCYELNEVDPILVQRLYLGQTLWIKTKLVYSSTYWYEGPGQVGIAPPMGRELPTIHILAYNFWTVSQKIKISVSMDSLCRAESEDVNYARIDWTPCRPFWNLSHIFISSEPFDISSQKSVGIINHVLDVPQKYEDSATYCSRDITILEKMLNF